jgi:hypothetical protein
MPRKISGPLGGLNEGRDKLFFFIDYEGRRQLIGDTQVVTGLPAWQSAPETSASSGGL